MHKKNMKGQHPKAKHILINTQMSYKYHKSFFNFVKKICINFVHQASTKRALYYFRCSHITVYFCLQNYIHLKYWTISISVKYLSIFSLFFIQNIFFLLFALKQTHLPFPFMHLLTTHVFTFIFNIIEFNPAWIEVLSDDF